METTSIRFAEAARCLGEAARRLSLTVPAFRSPPRQEGVTRTIRRRADGGATVSVVLRERPWPAVLADLIDGVVAANQLAGPAAATARDGLWFALAAAGKVTGDQTTTLTVSPQVPRAGKTEEKVGRRLAAA